MRKQGAILFGCIFFNLFLTNAQVLRKKQRGSLEPSKKGFLYNPGNVPRVKKSLGLIHSTPFMTPQVQNSGLYSIIGIKEEALGITLYRNGTNFYSQKSFSLLYGKKIFKNLYGGIGLNLLSIKSGNEQTITKYRIFTSSGLFYVPSQNVKLSLVFENPEKRKVPVLKDEFLSTSISTSIKYYMNKKLSVLFNIYSEQKTMPRLRFSLRYEFYNSLAITCGFTTSPFNPQIGIQYQHKALYINLTTKWHPILGYSPSISLTHEL